MTHDLGAVLAAVRAGDAASVPVLADLLEEAGDPRAAAVRALREEPHGWRVRATGPRNGGTFSTLYVVWAETPEAAEAAREALVASLAEWDYPTEGAFQDDLYNAWSAEPCGAFSWESEAFFDGEGAPARLCARAAALFLPLRILDCAAGPGGVVLLDGKGGVLPRGAEPVYLECRPGEVARNSRGQPFDPQPHFPAEG